jgi:hypothetical protein
MTDQPQMRKTVAEFLEGTGIEKAPIYAETSEIAFKWSRMFADKLDKETVTNLRHAAHQMAYAVRARKEISKKVEGKPFDPAFACVDTITGMIYDRRFRMLDFYVKDAYATLDEIQRVKHVYIQMHDLQALVQ